ncbi:hypothetical protein GGR52DRAFT_492302 [Hypoxylon sp. FL1284]|nr:hypothetical protein GGR52DRAFT_492302 [Hypoxylon sp. FL1284]
MTRMRAWLMFCLCIELHWIYPGTQLGTPIRQFQVEARRQEGGLQGSLDLLTYLPLPQDTLRVYSDTIYEPGYIPWCAVYRGQRKLPKGQDTNWGRRRRRRYGVKAEPSWHRDQISDRLAAAANI